MTATVAPVARIPDRFVGAPATIVESPAHRASSGRNIAATSNTQINANIMKVLHDTLPASRATLDGDPITGIRPSGECSATITTAKGTTTVSWRDLGNLAPTDDGKTITFNVPAGNVTHKLSTLVGEDGDHLNMALGVLDGNCSAQARG